MIRIALSYWFNLSRDLEPIAILPNGGVPLLDVILPMVLAENAVKTLHENVFIAAYLRSSYPHSQALRQELFKFTSSTDVERKLGDYELLELKRIYGDYKIALLAEIGSFDTYFVTQKGGFDTLSMLMFGENMFPIDLGTKVPEAIFDVREAGKCLAYEIPTASAFHIFRATESVLRKYYSVVTSGSAHPKVRSLGVYLHALKMAGKGDAKVRAALEQMTNLHRNPLIHPEAVITNDEALAIHGIARSAITAMLAVLPVVPPTTGTSSISLPTTGTP